MNFVDLCDTDYSGPCGKSALGSFSAADKEDFAWRCRVSWACEDACVKDFSACPSECVQRCSNFMFVAHYGTFNVVRFLSSNMLQVDAQRFGGVPSATGLRRYLLTDHE